MRVSNTTTKLMIIFIISAIFTSIFVIFLQYIAKFRLIHY